jgi:hypothetical protein
VRCYLTGLKQWADLVPSAQLAALRAARFGSWVLLLGSPPPLLPDGERYWGQRILVPLGQRVEPALPESALCEALALRPDEVFLLGASGGEVVSLEVFQPLTRAGTRLAVPESR